MEHDNDKIDEMILALMCLSIHDGNRTWKSFDWDSMNRLHQKGLISNPVNKNKSVELTQEGMEQAKILFNKHFSST